MHIVQIVPWAGKRVLPVKEVEVLVTDGDGGAHAGHESQHTADRGIRLADQLRAGGNKRAQVAADDVFLEHRGGKIVEIFVLFAARAAAAGHTVAERSEKSSAVEIFGRRFLDILLRTSVWTTLRVCGIRGHMGWSGGGKAAKKRRKQERKQTTIPRRNLAHLGQIIDRSSIPT